MSKQLLTGRNKRKKADPHSVHGLVFPTLNMRQTDILLYCIEETMTNGAFVSGEYVSAHEWQELLRTLIKDAK